MMMVKYLPDTPTSALGDFAGTLDGANADVLAGYRRALAHIPGRVERMKRDEVACAFSDALGRRSSSLGGSFADVASPAAYVPTGATLRRILLCSRL
jgi:hypothetical protein